jgi:predicted  nucleic acid-binding Zn-ribbon protein
LETAHLIKELEELNSKNKNLEDTVKQQEEEISRLRRQYADADRLLTKTVSVTVDEGTNALSEVNVMFII